MQETIFIETDKREGLYDITKRIEKVVSKSGIKSGLVNVYVRGATAGIMIQEGWDDSVQNDVINFLKKYIPQGVWEHDKHDNNADAHIKSGLVGAGESVPLINGKLGLSRWQNIFLCEFDGPRKQREIVVSIIENQG